MPIEIKDLDEGLGVSIIGRGVITDEEYLEALTEHLMQNKEKFKKYRYSLSDFTAVTKVCVSTKTITLINNLCISAAKINPNAVVATVADRDLIYGLARMSQLHIAETGWESMVFRDRRDAEAWIKKRVLEKYRIGGLTVA